MDILITEYGATMLRYRVSCNMLLFYREHPCCSLIIYIYRKKQC